MSDILNSNNKIKKHFIHKKYKLLIEISFKEGVFTVNQKLNSFFGQIGVYEGGDKLINFIELYFKTIFLDYINLGEDGNGGDVTSSEKDLVFYLPVFIYFYFGEKKCDFFINKTFKKNYYDDKKITELYNSFLKYNRFCFNFNSKNFYYEKLKERYFLISELRSTFKLSNRFFDLLNSRSIDFLIDEDKFFLFNEEVCNYKSLKKKRILFFKKILIKSKNNLVLFAKKTNWFCFKFLLNFIIYKFLFIDYFHKHFDFFKKVANVFSQFLNLKNKFFFKFKRYKKFKKAVFRNNFGKKISYFKIYRYDYKTSKKKKR